MYRETCLSGFAKLALCVASTFFENLGSSVRPRVGEALVHPGDLRHGGAPVVHGVRYVLVGFLRYK